MEFLLGGVAAVGAGCFTNPLEVLKTRMQLQGELQSRGKHAVHYRNVFHAALVIVRHDGIFALQNGLVPALWTQLFLNGIRLGTFQTFVNWGWTSDKNGKPVLWKTVILGGVAGICGAFSASPFFLVKTQLQSQANSVIAQGHQHGHSGTIDAFKTIYRSHGFKGFYRGATAAVPRAFVGSCAQLSSFTWAKKQLEPYEIFAGNPIFNSFVASMISGVFVTFTFTPFDLLSTRLYNQGTDHKGKGLLYTGYLDCVSKIWHAEGMLGFYKGIGPSYLRIGPHTVLCLVFWDELKKLYKTYAS